MGNIIRDFWTYEYRQREYYGYIEVVAGEDLAQARHEKKYDNHVVPAMNYVMKHDIMSHMSIQTYAKTLEKYGRTSREEDEEAYYPFILEFEPNGYSDQEYKRAVEEAERTAKYAINELGFAEENILIMINNSRSVYLMFNPKSYGLKPRKDLHKIYKDMYDMLDEVIGFSYVDKSFYSSYKLMKTPNSYYKGGYFVRTSLENLKKLYTSKNVNATRASLTSQKKSLNHYEYVTQSFGMTKMFQEACAIQDEMKTLKKEEKEQLKSWAGCIEAIESSVIEKGCRNDALVSVAIHYKNQGWAQEDVKEKLVGLASKWGHDESASSVMSKANSVYRHNTKFSCKKAREALFNVDMDNACKSCPYNPANSFKATKIAVYSNTINELYSNGASNRHYVAYLELSKKDLFNRWFDPEDLGLNSRTIRELCTKTQNLERKLDKVTGLVYIENKEAGNRYMLPKEFMDNKVHERLGESLKHYLKLIIKGYKAYDRYIVMRVSKEKIREDLGYKTIYGVYKLISKLKTLGLVVMKKGLLVSVYYESKKVYSLETHRAMKKKMLPRSDEKKPLKENIAVGQSLFDQEVWKSEKRRRGYENTNKESPPG